MIRGGRSVKTLPADVLTDAAVRRGSGLPATSQGRSRMGDSFFDAATALLKFAADSFTNAVLIHVIKDGAFQSDAATRALFASGFVTRSMLSSGFLKSKIIAGGAAGDHTVSGIATGDDIVAVWRFIAAGLPTDLTAEFSITAANTINNAGGTNTAGDALGVIYLDLT